VLPPHPSYCVTGTGGFVPGDKETLFRNTWGYGLKHKVRQSLCRLGQALRVSEGRGSCISRQSAHEGGKVVSPTHRSSLPPRKYSGTHF